MRCRYLQGDIPKAQAQYALALTCDPGNRTAVEERAQLDLLARRVQRGEAYMAQKQYKQAVTVFSRWVARGFAPLPALSHVISLPAAVWAAAHWR
jgi:hypothetical protein